MKKDPSNKSRSRDDSATDSQDESDFEAKNALKNTPATFLKKIKIKGYDTPDALPKKLDFKWLDIIGIVVSIISFFFDVVMDILVALAHYNDGNKWYFILTVCFIAIPSLAMTGFSLRWYLVDADEKKLPAVSTTRWVLRIVFLFFQMGPVLRYIDSLYFGLKSNRNKSKVQKQVDFYKQMIYEDADATLLRLFECFMESAPQIVLQLYIYAVTRAISGSEHSVTEILQLLSIFTSLVSMAWALAAYQRALRYSLQDKKNLTLCGTIVQILWRFFDIASRVLALSLFASLFPTYLFIVCGAHYLIMLSWLRCMKTDFCENPCAEFLYNAVLGVVFIFCYFNPKDSPTRRRFTFYYVCIFLENSALMSVWFINCPPHVVYKYPAMSLQFISFILGLVIMIIYYLLFHPTKNIKIWSHWTKTKPTEITIRNGVVVQTEVGLEENIQDVRV